MNGEPLDQHLDTLERSFQALRDRASSLAGAGETLAPALQEVEQALAAVREVREAGACRLKKITPVRDVLRLPRQFHMAASQRAQEILRDSEEKYRRLIETTNSGFVLIDTEGKVLDANPKYVRISGHNSLEEILGRSISEWTSDRDRERNIAEVERCIREGSVRNFEIDYQVNGQLISMEINATAVNTLEGLKIISLVKETTENKRAEEALQTQTRVLERMAEAVTVVSEDNCIVFANPAAYVMFGYEEGELVGQKVSMLNEVPEAENDCFMEIVEQVQKTGAWAGEVRNRKKDGTSFFSYARVSALDLPGKRLWVSVQEDITARKYLEEATAGYLEFIRLLLETIPNPIFYNDFQGVILGCNKAFAEFLGVPQPDIPGLTVYDLFPSGLARKFDEMDQEAMQHPEIRVRARLEVPGAEGSASQIMCHNAAFMDSSGGVGGVVSIITDITDLHRAEEALRKSEKTLRTLIEGNPESLFLLDAQGVVLACSKVGAQRLGKSLEDLVGTNIFAVFPADLAKKRFDFIQQVIVSGQTSHYEDSREGFHFIGGITPILNQDDIQVALMAVDITARKRAEEALRESEARLRAIFEYAPVGIAMSDVTGQLLQTNPAYQAIVGYTVEELRGMTFQELTHPEDLPENLRLIKDMLAGKCQQISLVKRYIRKDGSVRLVQMMVNLLRNDQEAPQYLLSTFLDITDLRRAEEAVQESEARLRAIFEHAPVGITMVDATGRFLQTNLAYQTIVGYSAAELQGMTWQQITHPEDLPENERLQEELLAGQRQSYQIEKRYLRKDGEIVWVSVMVSSLHNAEGELRLVATIIDITARKQAEEALRKSEQRFRDITENTSEWIWEVNAEGKYTYSSPMVKQLLGYDPEEVLNYHFYDLFSPNKYQEQKKRALDILATKQPFHNFLNENSHRNGQIIWISTSGIPIFDDQGTFLGYRGSDMDITAQKRAEEALRESEQRFRLMAETIQDVFWIGGIDFYKLEYVSPGYEKIYGRPSKQLYHSGQSFIEAIHPDDRERVRAEHAKARAQGISWSQEFRIFKPDGEMRWIQDRGFPVRGEKEDVILFTGVATDITERKILEQQLLLAQKMEAVGRLAGGVAHDFNNLLMAIAGYSELMQAKVLKGDPLWDYLGEILKATDQAAALTGQLLTFSRQQIVYPQSLDLNLVILDMERMLRRLIEEDIDLKIITTPKLGAVRVDPGYLNQIIMNLVINARDAMPCGGHIIVETAEVDFYMNHQTRSGLAPPGPYVLMRVSDSGIGMDESIQSHIFDPFFTTKEPGKGTGLGLSTVYGIIKQSGGFIDLKSEPGKGSTFTIYFPRLEAATEPPKKERPQTTLLRGEGTVLLVEDEDVLRTLLSKFLRLHGYTVLEARHGGEALRVCEEHQGPIKIMVTDVVMPEMSGRELADRLMPLHPEMRIIYMSGYTEDEVVQRGVAELTVAFLQKPFKPIDLLYQVHAVLHAPERQ